MRNAECGTRSDEPEPGRTSAFRVSTTQHTLATPEATEAFGRKLGSLLFPNAVLALDGQLGAGKTHLSRAIAEGLGVRNPAAVTSPTFVLIQEYPARLPIFHFDAYRLTGPQEFLELGVEEYFTAGGVCLIEWAERVRPALPVSRLDVQIDIVYDTLRRLTFVSHGVEHERLLFALCN